jgi:hypothetical protein
MVIEKADALAQRIAESGTVRKLRETMSSVLRSMTSSATLACLCACAQTTDTLPGNPMTKEAFDAVAETVRLMREDSIKFYASHDLKGQPASAALTRMTNEGFECVFESRDYVFVPPEKPFTFSTQRVPVIYCERRIAEQESICAERRVTFKVTWQDAAVPVARLWTQTNDSLVTGQTYACTPRNAATGGISSGRYE